MPQARLKHFQVALKSAVVMAAVVQPFCLRQQQIRRKENPVFRSCPITMVVPLPAGGTADLLCRIAAEKAGSILNQQIVVENRAGGAGGRVGTELVLRSPPDGYTSLRTPADLQHHASGFHQGGVRSAGHGTDQRARDLSADRAACLGLPADNIPELIAYARAHPGTINYGHQGKGNTGHLLGELLMLRGDFRMTEIPYRGSAPAIHDLLAGNIDMVCDYLLANKPNIDSGNLKMLGTAGRERL